MKKLILSAALMIGLGASVYAQGTIQFDNSNNTSSDPNASSGGLFWLAGATTTALNQDVNAELLGGSTATSLQPIITVLLSDGTATGDMALGGGLLVTDGHSYNVPGTSANGTGFFEVEAWLGNYSSLAAAIAAGSPNGTSAVFSNPLGGGATPGTTLTGMPAVVLTVPEPGTFALAGLGAAALLIFRRRK